MTPPGPLITKPCVKLNDDCFGYKKPWRTLEVSLEVFNMCPGCFSQLWCVPVLAPSPWITASGGL